MNCADFTDVCALWRRGCFHDDSPAQLRERFAGHYELKCNAIVAIALPRWWRSVVEDVSLVTTATCAMIFSARQDQLEITFRFDGAG